MRALMKLGAFLFAAMVGPAIAQVGGGGGQPAVFGPNDAMIHSPILTRTNAAGTANRLLVSPLEAGSFAGNDPSPLWGRNAPKIVRIGSYYYTVVPCALSSVDDRDLSDYDTAAMDALTADQFDYDDEGDTNPRPDLDPSRFTGTIGVEKVYHRDITLYRRHCGSTLWDQMWTEEWVSAADGRLGSRRGFEPASIVVNNRRPSHPEDLQWLHIVFTGVDNLPDSDLQRQHLRHYAFALDSEGSVGNPDIAPVVPLYVDMSALGDNIPRWGISASRSHRYMYLVGPEFGTYYRNGVDDDEDGSYPPPQGNHVEATYVDGNDDDGGEERNKFIRILRCDPNNIGTASPPWQVVSVRQCNAGESIDYIPEYLVDSDRDVTFRAEVDCDGDGSFEKPRDWYTETFRSQKTLQYVTVDSIGHRTWILGSVHDWAAHEGDNDPNDPYCNRPSISGYHDGVRLIFLTDYGRTLRFDIRLPDLEDSCAPFRTTFGIDLAVTFEEVVDDPGSTWDHYYHHRVFALARNNREPESEAEYPLDTQNRLYVYDLYDLNDASADPCVGTGIVLKGIYDVPGSFGDRGSLYYAGATGDLYILGYLGDIAGPYDYQLGVWRVTSASLPDGPCGGVDPAWSLNAFPVKPPLWVQSWPDVRFEYAQAMADRAGGDLPADGLHLIATYRLGGWATTFNHSAHSDELGVASLGPGRLMRDARGVWDLQLDVFGNYNPQNPCGGSP